MNKTELVSAIADASGLTKVDSNKAVDALMEVVTKQLKKGEEVKLTGFGAFKCITRSAREGRNPSSGAVIKVPKKKIVKFKAGVTLTDSVN